MQPFRVRTQVEIALGLLLAVFATAFIRVGHASDAPRKEHSKIECSYCHAAVADLGDDVVVSMDLSRQCANCHRRDGRSSAGLSFHETSTKRCGECHSFHETDRLTAAGTEFTFRFDKRSSLTVACAACHGEGENPTLLSPGHQEAARLYHSNYGRFAGMTASQTCLLCHNENGAAPEEASGLKIPRFQDHGDHPLGIKVTPGSGIPGNRIRLQIDSRLSLVNGTIECQTCHSLSSNSYAHLRGFASLTELCTGCHSVD